MFKKRTNPNAGPLCSQSPRRGCTVHVNTYTPYFHHFCISPSAVCFQVAHQVSSITQLVEAATSGKTKSERLESATKFAREASKSGIPKVFAGNNLNNLLLGCLREEGKKSAPKRETSPSSPKPMIAVVSS